MKRTMPIPAPKPKTGGMTTTNVSMGPYKPMSGRSNSAIMDRGGMMRTMPMPAPKPKKPIGNMMGRTMMKKGF